MASDFDRLVEILQAINVRLQSIDAKIAAGVAVRLTLDPRALAEINQKLDLILTKEIQQMATIDDILREVNELPDINASLEALFARLAGLIGSGDPTKMQQALDILVAQKDRTKADILANTPAAPPTP